MPVLRQRRDGEFYIRGVIPGVGRFCTWQVTDEGVALLHRSGIGDGDDVPAPLIRALRDRGLLYTYGAGLGATSTPPPDCLPAGSVSSLPLQLKVDDDTWQLSIVLPALPNAYFAGSAAGDQVFDRLDTCGFRVDHGEFVSGWRLWPGRGDTTCQVLPHTEPYDVEVVGTWPAHWDLTTWTRGGNGLRASGTLFAGPDFGGLRLPPREPVAAGATCYLLVVREAPGSAVRAGMAPIPAEFQPRELGRIGIWTAWELSVPSSISDRVRDWLLALGHPTEDPAWRLSLVSPPPVGYSPSGMPLIAPGARLIIAVQPPPSGTGRSDSISLVAERDGIPIAQLWIDSTDGLRVLGRHSPEVQAGRVDDHGGNASAERALYFAWSITEGGGYRLRASAGRVSPLAFAVSADDASDSADLAFQPEPLEVLVTNGSAETRVHAFVDGPGPHEIPMPPSVAGHGTMVVTVRCAAPVDASWSSGQTHGRADRVRADEVQDLIAADLNAAQSGRRLFMLRLDAGSFGRLHLQFVPAVDVHPGAPMGLEGAVSLTRLAARRAHWLATALPALLERQDMDLAPLPGNTGSVLARVHNMHEASPLAGITAAPRPVVPHLRAVARALGHSEGPPQTRGDADSLAATNDRRHARGQDESSGESAGNAP